MLLALVASMTVACDGSTQTEGSPSVSGSAPSIGTTAPASASVSTWMPLEGSWQGSNLRVTLTRCEVDDRCGTIVTRGDAGTACRQELSYRGSQDTEGRRGDRLEFASVALAPALCAGDGTVYITPTGFGYLIFVAVPGADPVRLREAP